jgi:hypothetical protein
LRTIKNKAHFGPEEISLIYDYFFGALYYAKDHQDKSSVPEMDLTAFTKMLENMTTWAKLNEQHKSSIGSSDMQVMKEVLEMFICRLFTYFKSENRSGITLADTVGKLGAILRGVSMNATKDANKKKIDLNFCRMLCQKPPSFLLCMIKTRTVN